MLQEQDLDYLETLNDSMIKPELDSAVEDMRRPLF